MNDEPLMQYIGSKAFKKCKEIKRNGYKLPKLMKYLQKKDSLKLNEGESFWTIERDDKTTKLILITIKSKLEFDHQVVDQQQDDEFYIQKHKDSFIAF